MPANTEAPPLTRAAFRAGLLEQVAQVRAEDTRLWRLLDAGRAPRKVLQAYALATVRSAELFCATLAEMASKAPGPAARLHLLENLMEEEGLFLQPSRGLVSRPETSHPALARRFAAAVGLDPASLALESANHATGPGRAMLAEGRWAEAVSHLLIGQEYNFCHTAPRLAEALMKNGLSAHDVAFFIVHETADREHGEQAIAMVLDHADTRRLQDACIAEARAGAEAWLAAHGGRA